MNKVISMKILLFALIIGVASFLPKWYNEYFSDKYGEDAISWEFSVISVIALVIGILFDMDMGWWFWVVISIFVLLTLVVATLAGLHAKAEGASIVECVLASVMQILATAGIIIILFFILAALYSLDKKRKK